MQIICISCGSQSQGEKFAKDLAAKLGYQSLGRDQLLEEATRHRIPVGKLETAIIKPHIFSERLAQELEHYKALATSILCEKALEGNLVYYGRTGHLLLPGISHILKVRVVSDSEFRIRHVMETLQLPREKAKRYIEQIDDDRRKWVKTFYNIEWDVNTLYDLVLNLSYMNVNNAASAICSMAEIPEFKATPASTSALKDLYMASTAKLMLFSDRRTSSLNIRLTANNGVLNITYPQQQADDVDIISRILYGLKDVKEMVFTKAQTNILWIQEKFNVDNESYKRVLSLANNWDAAIELMRLNPGEAPEPSVTDVEKPKATPETWRETGIIDESEETGSEMTPDMSSIYEQLIRDGRAGGKRNVPGTQKSLINAIDRSANYRLIIFDNAFLSKGAAAKKRTLQEWSNMLTESLKTPVVSLNELQFKYQFGPKHLLRMMLFGGLTAVIVFLLFHFNSDIIKFLSDTSTETRIIGTAGILLFVPFFAYVYSTVTGLLLKLIKLE